MLKYLRVWPIGIVLVGTVVVLAAQQPVTVVNTPAVTLATTAATQSGPWTVQPGNTANTTPWLFQIRDAAGNARGANVDSTNHLSVVMDALPVSAALADSTSNPTTTGIASYNMCFNGTTWDRCKTADGGSGASSANTTRVIEASDSISNAVPTASTTGGASLYAAFQTSGAVFTAQIKGSAAQAYGIDCTNVAAAAVYVRLYNQTGAPASTDGANIVWRGIIPGSTTGAGMVVPWPMGRVFGTGLGIRISGAIADNDTTVLSANTVMCNVGYK